MGSGAVSKLPERIDKEHLKELVPPEAYDEAFVEKYAAPDGTIDREDLRRRATAMSEISEAAKMKAYSLRHQFRQCTRLERKLKDGSIKQVPYAQQDLYDRYIKGSLEKEVDDATHAHGYGKLSTGRMLGAFGPNFH